MADALLTRPFTAAPAVNPLVAYGYVTAPGNDRQATQACAALLELWCYTEGWIFGAMFVDAASGPDEVIEPGFTGLVDALPVYPRAAVLLVEPGDLSLHIGAALVKQAAIRRTGAQLQVLSDELAEAVT
ncbi:hypothetical protein H4696_008032 [Amycolatopsis lexingtonensis]|uniref:Uncharacterized protein n=1 Tax=Amycolatopsis lexingtonensis TaxID=218822 RepID=A0ABR9IDA3_9PSEU|nr:hypothetical protein [Amycolatopsis lexingtonensis]MBE1500932.1 hypothetical protein [Amycolatopsis lexingtonensis]